MAAPSKKDTKKFLEKIAKGEIQQKVESERIDVADLPRWVKLVVAKHEIQGATWKDACASIPRALTSLDRYKRSPAFKTWRAELQKIADDPVQLAQLMMRATVFEAAIDYLGVIEAAKEQNDYKEVRLAVKDMLKTFDVLKDDRTGRGGAGPIMIQVSLSGGLTAVAPEVETTYQTVEGDWEVDDSPG